MKTETTVQERTETTVQERRLADPRWVKRNRRSLCLNKQHRHKCRLDKELREAMNDLKAEQDDRRVSAIKTIQQIANSRGVVGRLARMVLPRRGGK